MPLSAASDIGWCPSAIVPSPAYLLLTLSLTPKTKTTKEIGIIATAMKPNVVSAQEGVRPVNTIFGVNHGTNEEE
jgi:hypothetical protein